MVFGCTNSHVWQNRHLPRCSEANISQPYLWYAVCVGKHGLESVPDADVVQNAHAALSLGLVSCNTNRGGGGSPHE